MSKKIGILDYNIGNLLSIKRAIAQLNLNALVIKSPKEILNCDALILPGVGAFRDGMNTLEQYQFIDPIRVYVNLGRPIIGICLGMQLLFEYSEEFGFTQGLGLIQGNVSKLPEFSKDNIPLRIPHVGWSPIFINHKSLFNNISEKAEYYFCHSYAVKEIPVESNIAHYEYGGHEIIAAVKYRNIYGFQFHPEKSGNAGLKLINNFFYEIGILNSEISCAIYEE